VGTILVVFSAAWAGAVFALWRFKSARWWEHKEKAYESVIEALHHMKMALFRTIEAQSSPSIARRGPEETMKEMLEADAVVNKAIDMSSFLMCPKATESFDRFQNMFNSIKAKAKAQGGKPIDVLNDLLDAVDRCLSEIKQIGKDDLGVK
jgi:CRISPR/Cas system CSM-associated protein Csm2 small subunit